MSKKSPVTRVTKRRKELVSVELTPRERIQRSEELLKAVEASAEHKDRAADVKKDLAAEQKRRDGKVASLAHVLHHNREDRVEDIEEVINTEDWTKYWVLLDGTGRVVLDMKIPPEDRARYQQLQLVTDAETPEEQAATAEAEAARQHPRAAPGTNG